MDDVIPERSDDRRRPPVDRRRLEAAVREILCAVGEDPDRPGLARTPQRVAAMYEELFAGLRVDPRRHLAAAPDELSLGTTDLVMLRDISFASLCEHHLLPFAGQVDIAYLPRSRVVGLSKLARVVDAYARRPQTQERLTCDVADALWEELRPAGCGVLVTAVHMCMTIRGVKRPGTTATTSAVRGDFGGRPEARAELLAALRSSRR